jgi:hypothetical protein
MGLRFLLPLILLAFGCATERAAPSGTVERAQQDYMQALEQCQGKYLDETRADAGIGAAQTKDDVEFSACLAPAKTTLEAQMRQASNAAGRGSS